MCLGPWPCTQVWRGQLELRALGALAEDFSEVADRVPVTEQHPTGELLAIRQLAI